MKSLTNKKILAFMKLVDPEQNWVIHEDKVSSCTHSSPKNLSEGIYSHSPVHFDTVKLRALDWFENHQCTVLDQRRIMPEQVEKRIIAESDRETFTEASTKLEAIIDLAIKMSEVKSVTGY